MDDGWYTDVQIERLRGPARKVEADGVVGVSLGRHAVHGMYIVQSGKNSKESLVRWCTHACAARTLLVSALHS